MSYVVLGGDYRLWPITIRVRASANELERTDPSSWLEQNLGSTRFFKAWDVASRTLKLGFGSYTDAKLFLSAFSSLELIDYTAQATGSATGRIN